MGFVSIIIAAFVSGSLFGVSSGSAAHGICSNKRATADESA
jgi:hypothetical protein